MEGQFNNTNSESRRKFLNTLSLGSVLALLGNIIPEATIAKGAEPENAKTDWQAGTGRRVITPQKEVWLAGFGTKRAPEGKIHDIWVKALALKDKSGKKAVLVTSDHQGMSRTIYESLYKKIHESFGLDRSEFMLTFSHNHSGPCLNDDLVDYYPSDEAQRELVNEYTIWMESQITEAVGEAVKNWQPVEIELGEGNCTFAVNRRDNKEAEVPQLLAEGIPLKGVVDHYVPVLSVRGKKDKNLLTVLFGYACHPTTLSGNAWCGDYPGFAQLSLEASYPGVSAMFFNTCGGDQNPIPRRTLELCKKYGEMLSDSVKAVLAKPMKSLSSGLNTDFSFVNIDYEEIVTKEKLLPIARGGNEIQARWAKRMLDKIDNGEVFPTSYPYPVQAWQLGKELLLIGIGGEAVVDYSLRFKKEFNDVTTWVSGYTNDMVAYIPSRRVWEEGGYEGGSHLDEYGRPAWRWAGDIEERISGAVHQVVRNVREK
jgi:neutral ceramidase